MREINNMTVRQIEMAIKFIKDNFEVDLASQLSLERVTAPIMLHAGTGYNDNLNGFERPVEFSVRCMENSKIEIVQSLAKWKRRALGKLEFHDGEGLYTDMNAIRPDENVDELHSVYVDQWDWEKIINENNRNTDTLKDAVGRIYVSIRNTESKISKVYPHIKPILPPAIEFITAQELEDSYPGLPPKQREAEITRKYGAVFIIGIGGKLRSGVRHDGRSPDYDDWDLNGDLLLWYPPLNCAMEISSMGIRVGPKKLEDQLCEAGCRERLKLQYHRELLTGKLPYTIGGGIGQSRLCMFLLRALHIGQVQASVWPEEYIESLRMSGIELL